MKCRCGGRFHITNTYCGGQAARTAAATCTKCGCRATLVEFVAIEEPSAGRGAYAVATALRRGELAPRLDRETVTAEEPSNGHANGTAP